MRKFESFLLMCTLSFPAYAMDLESYLEQVKSKNGGYKSDTIASESRDQRRNEASLFFKPSFFLTGEYRDDQRPTNSPVFQGTQTLSHLMRIGVSQEFRTGTSATLSYNSWQTQINGAQGGFVANKKFADVAPQLEISQSLLRNFLGSEVKAKEDLKLSQVEAEKQNLNFSRKQTLLKAENAYWRLYFSRERLQVQKDSLARAEKLQHWNQKKLQSNLIDDADLIQTEANYESRSLDLEEAMIEATTAETEFLSLIEQTEDVGTLQGMKSEAIAQLNVPVKKEMREDVLAALANQKAAEANATLGEEANRPDLKVYGSYAMYGRGMDAQYSNAYNQSMTASHPYSIIGVKFTMPLDVGALKDYRAAYGKEKISAQLLYKRKAYEVEQEWKVLTNRFGQLKKKYTLSLKLEKIEGKKLLSEKNRFNQGRTTTFQVLQFEQDFANSQLTRLKTEADLLAVHNQLRLFSGDEYVQ